MNVRILQWKRVIKAVLLILLLSTIGMTNSFAQEWQTLTLNDGTDLNEYVPFYGQFSNGNPTYSQFIIPASDLTEMATGGTIRSISFYSPEEFASWDGEDYWSGSWMEPQFEVRIKEVPFEKFENDYYYYQQGVFEWENMDLFFTGSLSISGYQMTIWYNGEYWTDNGYYYGGGNLLIGIKPITVYNSQNCSWYGVNEIVEEWGISPSASIQNGEFLYFKPKVTLEYRQMPSLTVNDGTDLNSEFFPLYYDDYSEVGSASQFVIPASELGDLSWNYIKALTLYCDYEEWGGDPGVEWKYGLIGTGTVPDWSDYQFEVRIKEVDFQQFEYDYQFDGYQFYDWEAMTLVYQGGLSVSNYKISIPFNVEPYNNGYQYEEGSHLLVGIRLVSTNNGYYDWNGTFSLYGLNEDYWLSTSLISPYDGYIYIPNFKPKVSFSYEEGDAPSCIKPQYLQANKQVHYATVSWTSSAPTFNLQYKKSTEEWDVGHWDYDENWNLVWFEGTTNVVEGLTETQYTIDSLDFQTSYDVRVQAVCNDWDVSDWASISFTTIKPVAPTDLTVTNLNTPEANTATLQWNYDLSYEYPTYWDIAYTPLLESQPDDVDFITIDATPGNSQVSYVLTNLVPFTAYKAWVRASFGNGEVSDWWNDWCYNCSFMPTNMVQVVLNEGTSTSSKVPFQMYQSSNSSISKSQFIIPASSLSNLANHEIWSMGFGDTYFTSYYGTNFKIDIYFAEVETEQYSTTEYYDWDNMEMVYHKYGSVYNYNTNEFKLDAPYYYEGGNLLVGINAHYSSNSSYNYEVYWKGIQTEGYVALASMNENVPEQIAFLPTTIFSYTPSNCHSPRDLAVNISDDETIVVLSWTCEETNCRLCYWTQTDPTPIYVEVSGNSYTFTDLPKNTYYWKIQSLCSDNIGSRFVDGPSFYNIVLKEPSFSNNTYEIYSTGELLWIEGVVNRTITSGTEGVFPTGNTSFTGLTVKLMKDIDLSTLNWKPIGNNNYYGAPSFGGDFDGNGHIINNLHINTHANSGSYYNYNDNIGLFAKLASGGVIHDVSIGGVSSINSDRDNTGGIVGRVESGGEVYDVGIDGEFIITCDNNSYVGGIVGSNGGTVHDVTIGGEFSVTGSSYVGGVIGSNSNGEIYNIGIDGASSITGVNNNEYENGWYVGGIVGSNGGTIHDVTIGGEFSVTGSSYVGGIIGNNSNVEIYNIGIDGISSVTGVNNSSEDISQYVGGIVGCNNGVLQNVYNNAIVNGYRNVGGIVGGSSGELHMVYNNAAVNGYFNVGGIAGSFSGNTITQAYSKGDVTAQYNAGGIVGAGDGGGVGNHPTLRNTYNRGHITAERAGGIVGHVGNIGHCSIYNSYSTGNARIYGYGQPSGFGHNYYLNVQYQIGSGGTPKTQEYMQSLDFVDDLNSNQMPQPWKADFTPNTNDGYPILQWQNLMHMVTYSHPAHGNLTVKNGNLTVTSGMHVADSTVLTVTATPNLGYTVESLTANGVEIENNTLLVTESVEITAVMVPVYFTVTYTQPQHGQLLVMKDGIIVESGSNVISGTRLTVTVTPEFGYILESLTANGQSINNNTLVVTESVEIIAVLIPQQPNSYSINATANPLQGGVTIGSGNYQEGITCTLTAVPNEDYFFVNWTENGEIVSTNNAYSFTVMGNRTLVANFELENPPLIDEGLMAYYPFEGNANDASGNGYHATPCNSFQYDEGKLGQSIAVVGQGYYESSGGHVLLPAYDFDISSGLTLSLWVKALDLSYSVGETYINFGNDIGSNSTESRVYIMQSPSWLSFVYHEVTISIPYQSSYTGTWMMYTLTCSSDGIFKAYVNGEVVGVEEVNYTVQWNTSLAALGRHWWDGGGSTSTRFIGSFDEVRIYNRPLSSEEVQALYDYNEGDYIIGAMANPVEGGTVEGAGSYYGNEICTLSATANEGYTFMNWTKNDSIVSTDATYSFMVTESGNYVAHFIRLLPDLHVTGISHSALAGGQQATISWTVQNDGTAATPDGAMWNDRVWLSVESRVAAGDNNPILLGTFENISALNVGEYYTQTQTFNIPIEVSGEYYLFVLTDAYDCYQIFWENNEVPIPYNPPPYLGCNSYHCSGNCANGSDNRVYELSEYEHGNNPGDVYNDNFYYELVDIAVPLVPDLQVISINPPDNFFSGTSVNVTADISNFGEVATLSSSWTDALYVASTPDFNSATCIATAYHSGALAVGSTYQVTFTGIVPITMYGEAYFFVKTDYYEQVYEHIYSNNNVTMSDPVNIILTPPADLMTADLVVPVVTSTGESFNYSYKVYNNGAGNANVSNWEDKVYISVDDTLGSNAILLKTHNHSGNLAPGSYYSISESMVLPASVASGFYYLYVIADADNAVFEYLYEDNNTAQSSLISVSTPDLQITEIMAPEQITSGYPINLSYTLVNNGDGAISNRNINDRIFLSESGNLSNAFEIANMRHNLNLPIGQSVTVTCNATAPTNLTDGTFHLIVMADGSNEIHESNEDNNTLSQYPMPVMHQPLPDLHPVSLNLPLIVQAGETVNVDFDITNIGDLALLNSNCTFDVYALQNGHEILCPVQSQTLPLGSYVSIGINETMHFVRSILVPPTVTSACTTFKLVVDKENRVAELDDNNNIFTANATVLDCPLPDLTVTNIVLPALQAGVEAQISFAVNNMGTADFNGTFAVRVYALSADTILCPLVLQTTPSTNEDYSIAVGASLSFTQKVLVPPSVTSAHAVFSIVVDEENEVLEANETNNVTDANATVTNYPFNLTTQNFTVPSTVTAGENTAVSWTVKNIGTCPNEQIPFYVRNGEGYVLVDGEYLPIPWKDMILLSDDAVLSDDDILLLSVGHNTRLNPNATYQVEQNVVLPYSALGQRYLLCVSDSTQVTFDNNRTDNIVAVPVEVELGLLPDLRITSLEVEPVLTSDRSYWVHYSVANEGERVTQRDSWVDAFYIGEAQSVVGAFQLASKIHHGTLAIGASYNDSIEILAPNGLEGDYFFMGFTDATGQIYEHENENDNVLAVPVTVMPPAPCDLIAIQPEFPSTVVSGEEMTVSWQLRNIGYNPAVGRIRNAVYLSTDATWSSDDVMLGYANIDINIATNEQQACSLSGLLTGVSEGNYYVIVKANILNALNESSFENNICVSLLTTEVGFPTLAIGEQVDRSMTSDQYIYYKLQVGPEYEGQTLSCILTTAEQQVANGLYLSHDAVPTLSQYDFGQYAPYAQEIEILIPALEQGDYYLLAKGSTQNGNPQQVSIATSIINFEILHIDADHGANTGSITTKVTGAKFDSIMDFRLVQGGEYLPAEKVFFSNSTETYTTFDLVDMPSGTYAMEAELPGGIITIKDGAFTIEEGLPAELAVNIVAPASVRNGNTVAVNIEYGNIGTTDLKVSGFLIVSRNGHPIGFTTEALNEGLTELTFNTGEANSNPDVLRPGYRNTKAFLIKATHSTNISLAVYAIRRQY